MKLSHRTRLAVFLPAAALGACSMAPKYVQPDAPVPVSWPVGDAYLTQSEAALPLVSYTEIFRDERLQALIRQALANNRDLRVAAANVAAARAQVRVVRSDQFPELGVNGSATYTDRNGGAGSGGVNGGVSGADGWSYSAQGGVSSFELDLFGKLANATQAQRNAALSTESAARTVRLGLVADLARAWSTYAADKDLLRIAQETAQNAQRSVELTGALLNAGVAPRTDLRQAQQILETARGDLASQKSALAQDINAIRLLIGAEFDQTLLPDGIDQVNASLAMLPAGTRSQVLLRRPDVIGAEYDLRAANADIGVARAQLFPSISLTGLLGFASNSLSSLFTDGAFAATGSGNASWSIFNAGGKAANVDVAKARRDAALATYEKTIQTAFREVADALADQGTLAERLRSAQAFTEAASDTAKLTQARYKQGIDSYLVNLDAQRSLYSARRAEIAVRLASASNRITLYRVLGGDQASETSPAR
ncbi:efflux transporter outer membrane subunit [Novosphingobium pentaromativorans]|uniref:RND efflux system outer membrane lipoprotein n=1 Tax=Novosphingobium pentaromativorans US6-1 TaxID=1088721 RepID=G6EI81_9SPHN|nr:efflux transporter outer membrane subunit [Novosphingobium pentaromativorans]AIT78711.1 transporter [Novosphingobium pentaromativorans US6-1]EHJ58823.1 RND efflux system outer membrane lipoprotein [Novosphingobium pentaromativorans US6-1]